MAKIICLCSIIIIGFIGFILNGYCVQYLWEWFIFPVSGINIAFWAACGINLLVGYLLRYNLLINISWFNEKIQDAFNKMGITMLHLLCYLFGRTIIGPVFVIGLGKIIYCLGQ